MFFGSAVKLLDDLKSHVCYKLPTNNNNMTTNDNNTDTIATNNNSNDNLLINKNNNNKGNRNILNTSQLNKPIINKNNFNNVVPVASEQTSLLNPHPLAPPLNTNQNYTNNSLSFRLSTSFSPHKNTYQKVYNNSNRDNKNSMKYIPIIDQSLYDDDNINDNNNLLCSFSLDNQFKTNQRTNTTTNAASDIYNIHSLSVSPIYTAAQFLSVYDMSPKAMKHHVETRAKLLNVRTDDNIASRSTNIYTSSYNNTQEVPCPITIPNMISINVSNINTAATNNNIDVGSKYYQSDMMLHNSGSSNTSHQPSDNIAIDIYNTSNNNNNNKNNCLLSNSSSVSLLTQNIQKQQIQQQWTDSNVITNNIRNSNMVKNIDSVDDVLHSSWQSGATFLSTSSLEDTCLVPSLLPKRVSFKDPSYTMVPSYSIGGEELDGSITVNAIAGTTITTGSGDIITGATEKASSYDSLGSLRSRSKSGECYRESVYV